MKPYYKVREITNLREMLYSSAEIYGEKTAFLWKGGSSTYQPISFNQFKSDVQALGTYLWSIGLAGKRVVVIGENCYPWAVSYMAVMCGLGTVVPVDKEINKEEINNIIHISEASAVLYAKSIESKFTDVAVQTLCFDDINHFITEGRKLLDEGKREYLDAPIDTSVLASLIFTSGTTGVSKGVMLSQHNICENLMDMCRMVFIGPQDVFLSVLPLHHVYECTCGFLCPLYRGSTIAYCEGLRYVAANLKECRATMLLAVPALLESMYAKITSNIEKSGKADVLKKAVSLNNGMKKVGVDLSRKLFKDIHAAFGGELRLMISGGAAVDPKILSGLRDLGIKAIQGYGLTECSPIAAVNRDYEYLDSAAGLCLPHSEMRIADPDENGTGEICYKGNNVMMGYYKAPEATAEVIVDGWFHTGDLGFIDKKGFVHITGRKKNVIVTSNGKNIFPEELEAYINRSPYVKESVIVGIMNERKHDYDLIAILVPEFEKLAETFGEKLSESRVYEIMSGEVSKVNGQVQKYKHIDYTIVRNEEFIKNTSKKIKRMGIADSIREKYNEIVLR